MKKPIKLLASLSLAAAVLLPTTVFAESKLFAEEFSTKEYSFKPIDETIVSTSKLFIYDSGLTFNYPDAVRGIYVTGHSAGGSRFA